MADKEVTTRLKFTTDGSGKAVADDQRKAYADLAKQEEDYQKKLRGRIDALKESARMQADLQRGGYVAGPAAPASIHQLADQAVQRAQLQRALEMELHARGVPGYGPSTPATVSQLADRQAGAIQQRAAVQAELVKRGVIEDPAAKKAAGEAAQAVQAQQQARTTAAVQALGLAGMGGAVGRYGQITQLGGALETAGYARAGGMVNKAALPLAAISATGEVGDMYSKFKQADQNPYLLSDEYRIRKMKSLPIVGGLLGSAIDFRESLENRGLDITNARFKTESRVAEQGIREDLSTRQQGFGVRMSEAATRRDVMAGLRPAAYTPGDRGTATGAQQYRDEQAILGLRDRAVKTATEAAAARRIEVESAARLKQLEGDRAGIAATQLRLSKEATDLTSGGVFGALERYGKAELGAQNLRGATERENEARANRERAGEAARAAQAANAGAIGDVMRGRLGVLEQRESRAESAAVRLTALGPAGRMQGEMALNLFAQLGNMAPPEIQAQAAAFAPQQTFKMQAGFGTGLMGAAARAAPGEPDYQLDLGGIRREIDTTQKGIREFDVRQVQADTAKAVEIIGALGGFVKEMQTALDLVKTDLLRGHINQNVRQ